MIDILLNNGLKMPILGVGTFPMNRLELVKAIYYASNLGYKSFDTSNAYSNEIWLDRALHLMKILNPNKPVFITTKLSNTDQRKGNVRKALKDSIKRLKVKSIDLYLMHWPNPGTYLDCWEQMEELYHEGLVKAIGVCNFHIQHLKELLKIATVIPVVNQIELHPLLNQKELQYYCLNKGIKIEAYSPFARMHPKLIENKTL